MHLSAEPSPLHACIHDSSLIPRPGRRRREGLVPIAMRQLPQENLGCRKRLYAFRPPPSPKLYEAMSYRYNLVPKAAGGGQKKRTVFCGTPGFLGVVGACACNRYQALFPPPSGLVYEASMTHARVYNMHTEQIRMHRVSIHK